MEIIQIHENKDRYTELLLIGDEQEDMVRRYMDRGEMYILKDPDTRAVCVVTEEGEGIAEIKNLAVYPKYRRMGYGKALIEFVERQNIGKIIQLGTGDSPSTVPFYEKCGYVKHHCVKDFFIKNYDHLIFEEGVQLIDMIYMRKYVQN